MRFGHRRVLAAIGVAAMAISIGGCSLLVANVNKTAINGTVPQVQYLHYACSPIETTTSVNGVEEGDLALSNGLGFFFKASDFGPLDCVFTEPASGGATSVSITCASTASVTCTSAPGSLVMHINGFAFFIPINVVNDYTVPTTPTTLLLPPICPSAGICPTP